MTHDTDQGPITYWPPGLRAESPPQGKFPDALIAKFHTRHRANLDHWSLIQVLRPNADDDGTNTRAEAVPSAPSLNPDSSAY